MVFFKNCEIIDSKPGHHERWAVVDDNNNIPILNINDVEMLGASPFIDQVCTLSDRFRSSPYPDFKCYITRVNLPEDIEYNMLKISRNMTNPDEIRIIGLVSTSKSAYER